MTWLPENDTDKIFTELDNQQDGTPFVLKNRRLVHQYPYQRPFDYFPIWNLWQI